MPYATVATFIVSLLGASAPWVLTLDRTNWCLGETPLNLLVLGIVYRGVAWPIFWTVLEKKGNSNTAERIALLGMFLHQFGAESIAYLTADREFIGKKWFSWLRSNKIAFRIRIKANTKVQNRRAREVAGWRLFSALRLNEAVAFSRPYKMWGMEIYLSGMRLKGGEYLIVASDEQALEALAEYAKRWEIETLFGCMKSRGFRLEETHVTDRERLKKLFALLAIAFCWAHIVGEWLVEKKGLKIKIKKHGRKARSIFRVGYDHLRRITCRPESRLQLLEFRRLVLLLSCT